MPSELPELAPQLSYLAGFDGLGEPKALQRPANRCIVVFDGVNYIYVDGTMERPLVIPDIYRKIGGDLPFIFGQTASGQVVAFSQPDSQGKWQLQSEGGVIKWVTSTVVVLPTGVGLFGRDQNNSLYALGDVSEKGLYYADGTGSAVLVPPGAVGSSLVVDSTGTPTFSGNISGGTSTGGGSSTGLSGVNSHNTSNTVAQITCPRITLSNGVDADLTATAVNVTVNTTVLGAGGIDQGSPVTGWYYLYIIGNISSSVSAIFSLSSTTPNLAANAPTYTHWAFAGCFYYATDRIRPYYATGRKNYIQETLIVSAFALTNALQTLPTVVPLTTMFPPLTTSICGSGGGLSTGSAGTAIQISPVPAASPHVGLDIRVLTGSTGTQATLTAPSRIWTTWACNFNDFLIVDPVSPAIYGRTQQTIASTSHGSGKWGLSLLGFTI